MGTSKRGCNPGTTRTRTQRAPARMFRGRVVLFLEAVEIMPKRFVRGCTIREAEGIARNSAQRSRRRVPPPPAIVTLPCRNHSVADCGNAFTASLTAANKSGEALIVSTNKHLMRSIWSCSVTARKGKATSAQSKFGNEMPDALHGVIPLR